MLFSSACGPSDSDFSDYSTFVSPDDKYNVIIDSAHSKLAFGPETIRVFVVGKDKGVRSHIVTMKIANDGGGISEENVKAIWIQPEILQLCLSGAEQDDSALEINVRSLSHTKENIKC